MLTTSLDDIAKYLVYQQFYDEEDKVIFDRTKKIRVLIPGVDKVVAAFLAELTRPITLLHEKKYSEYLTQLAPRLPFDMRAVEAKFQETKEKLGEDFLEENMVATLIIGEIINLIRDNEFKATMAEVKRQAMSKSTTAAADPYITSKISKFAQMNDLNISLLYNLSLLRLLVGRYASPDFPELQSKVHQMIEKYTKALVEQIIRGSKFFK